MQENRSVGFLDLQPSISHTKIDVVDLTIELGALPRDQPAEPVVELDFEEPASHVADLPKRCEGV